MAAAKTTLTAELNRLANGGATYPTGMAWRADAAAAAVWAATPAGTSVLKSLNVKAGNVITTQRDMDGVCNQLAGTTGYSAPEALRQRAS